MVSWLRANGKILFRGAALLLAGAAAGFGLGLDRIVMYLTGISNIRDVLPFPRTTGNADF